MAFFLFKNIISYSPFILSIIRSSRPFRLILLESENVLPASFLVRYPGFISTNKVCVPKICVIVSRDVFSIGRFCHVARQPILNLLFTIVLVPIVIIVTQTPRRKEKYQDNCATMADIATTLCVSGCY